MPENNADITDPQVRRDAIHRGVREGVRRAVAERRALGLPVYVSSNGVVTDISDKPKHDAKPG